MRVSGYFALAVMLCRCAGAASDRAAEVAQIHIAAIGGHARLQTLKAFRATGVVVAGGSPVKFTMTAARPDRVRMEYHDGDRTLVQATDGVHPPWELDTGKTPSESTIMTERAAKQFLAEAEFDDPLVGGAARGYDIDLSGEATVDGRKLLRLRLTKAGIDPFYLLLDAETYWIALRVDPPASATRQGTIITRYRDFRPVAGVLVPYEVAVETGGRLVQHARLETVEPNPEIPDGFFSRPGK